MQDWQAKVFGAFALTFEGRPIKFVRGNAAQIVAMLLLEPGRRLGRGEVARRLRPDLATDPEYARNLVRNDISAANKAAREASGRAHESIVDVDGQYLVLSPDIESDFDRWTGAIQASSGKAGMERAETLGAAVQAYGAGVLPDETWEWAVPLRRSVQRTQVQACLDCAEAWRALGRVDRLVSALDLAVAASPDATEVLAVRYQMLKLAGKSAEAKSAYRAYETLCARVGEGPEPWGDAEPGAISIPAGLQIERVQSFSPSPGRRVGLGLLALVGLTVLVGAAAVAVEALSAANPRLPHDLASDQSKAIQALVEDIMTHSQDASEDSEKKNLAVAGDFGELADISWRKWGADEDEIDRAFRKCRQQFVQTVHWTAAHNPSLCVRIVANAHRSIYRYKNTTYPNWQHFIAVAVRASMSRSVKKDSVEYGRLLVAEGLSYIMVGGEAKSLGGAALRQAIGIFDSNRDNWDKANALRHLGMTLSDYSKQGDLYRQAEHLFSLEPDTTNRLRGKYHCQLSLCQAGRNADSMPPDDEMESGCQAIDGFINLGNRYYAIEAFDEVRTRMIEERGGKPTASSRARNDTARKLINYSEPLLNEAEDDEAVKIVSDCAEAHVILRDHVGLMRDVLWALNRHSPEAQNSVASSQLLGWYAAACRRWHLPDEAPGHGDLSTYTGEGRRTAMEGEKLEEAKVPALIRDYNRASKSG